MGAWWIDEPSLLGSSNPTDTDLANLCSRGFTVLISLLDEAEQSPRYDLTRAAALGYTRHNIPIRDFHTPSVEQLANFTALLRSLVSTAKVVVHCEAGIGRTGTMAAAYWIAKGLTAAEAIQKVRAARPGAVETDEQEATLGRFAKLTAAGGSVSQIKSR